MYANSNSILILAAVTILGQYIRLYLHTAVYDGSDHTFKNEFIFESK